MLRVLHSEKEREPRPLGRVGVAFSEGFHGEETDDLDAFRWMGARGRLRLPDRHPGQDWYLELWLSSPFFDLSQRLEVEVGDRKRAFVLPPGWSRLSIELPREADTATLAVDRPMPPTLHPGDPRTLTIQLRQPLVHRETARHRAIERQHANAVLNQREMLDGASVLESRPPSLGIDLHGACNVKPPCVYCEWDHAKDLEGDNVDRSFTLETLDEYGDFFDTARNLVNCSIGEPFMLKEFDDLLDRFGDEAKNLELSTNGQILTDRNIERLLGRPIDLYVSLDAATPETYAKLRNDKLEKILVNLRRLLRARGGRGAYPRVNLVFMPMRVNLHELEAFAQLAADLGVDRLVLRPLNWADSSGLDWERAGHHFVYADELLPFDEIIRASGRAAAVCRRLGVPLSDQLDFGGAMRDSFERLWNEGWEEGLAHPLPEAASAALEIVRPEPPAAAPAPAEPSPPGTETTPDLGPDAEGLPAPEGPDAPATEAATLGAEKQPICTEPWKSFYILRRGVLPCCYGGAPIAEMDDYRKAWDSPKMRSLRKTLAAGRFHRYCIDSPSCPLVRKAEQAGTLRWRGQALVRARRLWVRFDRALGGVPGFFYRPVKRAVLGLLKRP